MVRATYSCLLVKVSGTARPPGTTATLAPVRLMHSKLSSGITWREERRVKGMLNEIGLTSPLVSVL